MSIYTKMHAVMKAVEYIQKDSKNEFHRYTYASERAIKEAMHAALVDAGVVFQFNVDDCILGPEFQTKKGARQQLTILKCSYAFVDSETGEKMEGRFVGSGVDGEDKGVYKAITGAIKYILTSSFLIPTGDDPEEDKRNPTDKDAPKTTVTVEPLLTATQCKQLGDALTAALGSSAKAQKWLADAGYSENGKGSTRVIPQAALAGLFADIDAMAPKEEQA